MNENTVRPQVHVVDDDEGVRSMLSLLVESWGMEPRVHADAQSFLESGFGNGSGPHCLILDLQMPGMNGAELREALQARGADIPTVVLTARPNDPLAQRALTAGARTVLAKPFDAARLETEVRRAVEDAA